MPEPLLSIRPSDIIDILVVAYLMYQVYLIIKGTVALNIIIAIISMFLLWKLVQVLKMEMMDAIMAQVFDLGAIALIILFQQEIRHFLVQVGTRNMNRYRSSLIRWFSSSDAPHKPQERISEIAEACSRMSADRSGALIVVARRNLLRMYAETGDEIRADISCRLIENIFFKNTPLHDGAMIIEKNKILAVRCILPLSENRDLPPSLGLRHRAALGITERTDAVSVVVSEETGKISVAVGGQLRQGISRNELIQFLEQELSPAR